MLKENFSFWLQILFFGTLQKQLSYDFAQIVMLGRTEKRIDTQKFTTDAITELFQEDNFLNQLGKQQS